MDRLVKPNVKELDLVFNKDHKCCTTFELTNLMHTLPVAVFLETTEPSFLTFTKPFSVIPPLGSESFTLQSQPLDQPPLFAPVANVVVRSSMVLTRKTDQESLRGVFLKPGPRVFKDAMIPVSFIGPQVVEFLIRSRTVDNDIPLIVSKSVPFCSEYDLDLLLRSATEIGNYGFVMFLINNNVDVNTRGANGESVMSLAVGSGNVDVVRAIVDSGFVIDQAVDRFLHEAGTMNAVDIMEVLCMSYLDLDINSIDLRGRTPLHICAHHGYIEVVEFLVRLGSDPSIVDDRGWTPLHCASSEGHEMVVEILLHACSYVKYALTGEGNGKSAIALAYENGHTDLYDMLYLGDVLQKAATVNDVSGLEKCLVEGAKVDGKDQNGWTALHRASFKGHVESVEVLVNHGARVDLVDSTGCTALHRAIEAGHRQVVVLLMARGARANMKSLGDHVVFDLDCVEKHHSLVVSLC